MVTCNRIFAASGLPSIAAIYSGDHWSPFRWTIGLAPLNKSTMKSRKKCYLKIRTQIFSVSAGFLRDIFCPLHVFPLLDSFFERSMAFFVLWHKTSMLFCCMRPYFRCESQNIIISYCISINNYFKKITVVAKICQKKSYENIEYFKRFLYRASWLRQRPNC